MKVRAGWIAGSTFDKEKGVRLSINDQVKHILTEGIAVNSKAYFNVIPGKQHVHLFLHVLIAGIRRKQNRVRFSSICCRLRL